MKYLFMVLLFGVFNQVYTYSKNNFPVPQGGLVWLKHDSVNKLYGTNIRLYIDHDSMNGQWVLVHIFDKKDVLIDTDK